jgi:hypothetical protein
LLREFPLFGKKETADTISELETIVGRYLATRNRLEQKAASRPDPKKPTPEEDRLNEELRAIQLNFDQALKKYAMDYAEKQGFNLTIKDSLGPGDYLYIEKKRWRRQDVSYEMPSPRRTAPVSTGHPEWMIHGLGGQSRGQQERVGQVFSQDSNDDEPGAHQHIEDPQPVPVVRIGFHALHLAPGYELSPVCTGQATDSREVRPGVPRVNYTGMIFLISGLVWV